MGFILLALCINSVESIESYIFYILQYTLSNLNAFFILVSIGFSLYLYVYNDENKKHKLIEQNNSPIQLIDQIKGYFYINSFIAISLAITLFSFIGIPPVIGFFAKQMILSAALDNSFVFMALIAILTSVIGAAYYLNVIKEIFFYKDNYIKEPFKNTVEHKHLINSFYDSILFGYILPRGKENANIAEISKKISFTPQNITLNSSLTNVISIITLLQILFIYTPDNWFNIVNILTLILFYD